MGTRLRDAISNRGEHKIGSLNTKWAKHVANGAKLTTANVDNYTLVEKDGRDADGNLQCKQLSAIANQPFLVTTVEEEQLMNLNGIQEEYLDFYNAKDEMVRLTRLETGVNFETSAFSKNTGVTTITKGMVAHFDPATKLYIVSDSASPHADFAGSSVKFDVMEEDSDFGYAYDVTTIQLEVQ